MADAELGAQRGLTRRQMIRASAVAGAAAWTAPMIVDSLASPAAAASGGSTIGCSWAYVFFKKPADSTVYYSAFQGTSACGSFASNNTAAVCNVCPDGVNYSINEFVAGEGGSVGNLRYGASCGGGGAPNAATLVTSASHDCENYLQVNGNTISAIGGATILAGFAKKAQTVQLFCGNGFDVGTFCGSPE
jgi:hypothetical protein